MTDMQINFIRFLLAVSVLCWFVPAVFALYKWFTDHNKKDKITDTSPLSRKLMILSVFLVVSVWFLRLAVSYYSEIIGKGEGLTVMELLFDSFIHALRTLSLDEEYVHYIVLGKEMIRDIVSEKYWCEYVYGIYASCLNLLTPLAGGAIVFDVLTTVFPKLKLKVSLFRNQYYFSELNERTLALAKSVLLENTGIWERPLLVFTDTYLDDESEKSSEYFLEAKKLGAVCINDDLAHLKVKCFREKQIFLMDEDEKENIKTLSEMCDNGYDSMIKEAQIYIFYQDDSYAMIEKRIYDKTKKHFEESGAHNDTPVITRVKEYENLILKLLAEKPLVEPLLSNESGLEIKRDEKREFNLTIIGSGKIGMQMFLSSTWAGQFYGYRLNINVVSDEKEKDFEDRLNRISPEILESTREESPLLKTYPDENDEHFQEPYFTVRYGRYKMNSVDLSKVECTILGAAKDKNTAVDKEQEAFNILESDYIFVALGSDELNIAIAEELERKISVRQKISGSQSKKVIAYVVYNDSFCSILNSGYDPLNPNIDMYPFGSVEETYSYKNVTMVNRDPSALSVHDVYSKSSCEEKKKEQEKRFNKSLYDNLSSKAREVHLKYRIFSSYLYAKENYHDAANRENLKSFDERAIDNYRKDVLSENAREEVLQYLTWLEHRRWNAYMRSIGFSQVKMKGKNINQKIHGCLFECSETPIDGNGEIRINDLKARLLNVVIGEQELNEKLFEKCICSWLRLPESEQIQPEILNENLKKSIEKLKLLKDGNKEKTDEAEMKNKITDVKRIIDICVDSSRKRSEDGQPFKEKPLDMLDLASGLNGTDMKFYDYPKDTDTRIIESIIKLTQGEK